jgi:hypothetical protein
MTKLYPKILLFCLTAIVTAGAGEGFSRKQPPPISNLSRTIFRQNGQAHQFTFRGGVVNYWPTRGAQWTSGRDSASGGTFAGAPDSAALPNGCLVYACARAEQIRLHPNGSESQSRVITYRRSDGSGHAFVLYKSGSAFVAEDNSGNKTPMPAFENRAAAEALFMAKTFQKRTAAGIFDPVQASFVGKF